MLEAFVGNTDGWGTVDGTGTQAAFYMPFGMVVDSQGNLFIADTRNHTIRKITPASVVTTFAGTAGVSGVTDGTGSAALFLNPQGMTVDAADNLIVADTSNHTIRKISPTGVVTTLAGTGASSGSADGTGAAARFSHPQALAVDSLGNIFVADSNNHTIRKIDTSHVVTTFAGLAGASGTTDGTGSSARFDLPAGIVVDADDNLYVADSNNHSIRRITPAGVVTTVAGTPGSNGTTDGSAASASFYRPQQIAIDATGNLYVADSQNQTIRVLSSGGIVSTLAGTANTAGSADGNGPAARFSRPFGVAVNRSSGVVYVSDTFNSGIRAIATNGDVTTLAGGPARSGWVDATGTAARFASPRGLATDSSGNLFVADTSNHVVRKVDASGVVTTFVGSGSSTGSSDGTGTAALFAGPYSVSVDAANNLYVADSGNNAIRMVTPAGVVTTLAGGAWGSNDGTGAASQFAGPYGLTADASGNVYVADTGNHTVRKIVVATGEVTTLAGSAGVHGSIDATGASAQFNQPFAITYDGFTGNLFLADSSNHQIRQITPAGVVTTLAGTATTPGSTDGTGTAALFNYPRGLTSDHAGNLYVADSINNTIRKIVIATGAVSTLVGRAGSIGFSGGALPGSLAYPEGVTLHGGVMYISTRAGVVKVTDF
jgi:sugar lactone lactonase YvrE